MPVKVDFEKTDRAIELPNGEVLDIPERTAELSEKFENLEKERASRPEYAHYQAVLELFFGKAGFKKLAPNGKKENLDYLAAIYVAAVRCFCADKDKLQEQEFERRLETIAPITDKINSLHPALKYVK